MAETKLVVFKIGGQDYAADIRDVREVIRAPAVTPLPHPAPPLVGVFNLRGEIVTAVDGHAALGLGAAAGRPGRAVILQSGGRTVGLLVDAASHVLTADEAHVRPAPSQSHVQSAKGILVHEGRPIVLLDVPFLLRAKQGPEARLTP